jgi:hypothetical protein
MRFVRENLFYVILAAVAVIGGGVATWYYFNSDIGKTLQSRTGVSSQLRDLADQPLKADPNAVEAMKARISQLTQANKADLQACLNFNRENLPILKLPTSAVSEVNAFPVDPARYRDQGLYFIFIKQYTKVLDQMISPLRDGLRPTTSPTPEEVQAEQNKLAEKFKEPGVANEKAFQSVKLHKAEQGLIYIEPSALDRVFTAETSASEDKLWEAQVNLWLTDEIIRAIIATNRQWIAERHAQGAAGRQPTVLDSAVKRLESIKISASFTLFSTGQRIRLLLGQRETCPQYAVVPYRFVVIMPTRHVRRLTSALEAQNYHTVTNISLSSEVPQAAKEGYYYGIEPIMRVQVDGEMLLLADCIRDLMPASLAVQFGKVGK